MVKIGLDSSLTPSDLRAVETPAHLSRDRFGKSVLALAVRWIRQASPSRAEAREVPSSPRVQSLATLDDFPPRSVVMLEALQ